MSQSLKLNIMPLSNLSTSKHSIINQQLNNKLKSKGIQLIRLHH
jgi:hypothetical protein